ncbi:MAG: hypothetical protein R8F63_09590 [Acidimicrobiales bacterium]|nr:hypothetical protein [Acidimicrobiales bacterium]
MKRIFWGAVGYGAGISTSVYVQRRVRRAVEHYTPEQIRHDVQVRGRQMADRARDVVVDLRDAAADGVATMRAREDELRREFAPGSGDDGGHRHRPARIRH